MIRRTRQIYRAFSNHGPAGVINLFRYYLDTLRRSEKVGFEPIDAAFGISSICNLRCVMCIRNGMIAKGRKFGAMSYDDFVKSLDKFRFLDNLNMGVTGEPLTNNDIFRMVEYASSKRITTTMYTNGTLLDEAGCIKLCEAGLGNIYFSIDAPEKKAYESIRIGADFDRTAENVKSMVKTRNKMKCKTNIFISSVVMKGSDLVGMVKFAGKLGVDGIMLGAVNEGFAGKDGFKADVGEAAVSEAKKVAKDLGLKLFLHLVKDRCLYPWRSPFVDWRGYMGPCCEKSDTDDYNWGNILKKSFQDVWNGEAARVFRRQLKNSVPRICEDCFYLKWP